MKIEEDEERDAVYYTFQTAREEAIAIIVEQADYFHRVAYNTEQEKVSQARLAVARELRKIAADTQADDEAPGAERITDGD